MNIRRGLGAIVDVLVGSLWSLLTGAVEAVLYIWNAFFGPPDEPPKEPEWHRH